MPRLKCRRVKSALTRLTMLCGVSLILCMSSGAGVALAGKCVACNQYIENVPTLHGKHHGKRHQSTTTSPSSTVPTVSGRHSHKHRTSTAGHHHRHKVLKHRHHRVKKSTKPKSSAGRGSHAIGQGATGRPAAAVTSGSGGGISPWLIVIVILVLVGGSAAGILRYRRSH